jgi:hypothetical protein
VGNTVWQPGLKRTFPLTDQEKKGGQAIKPALQNAHAAHLRSLPKRRSHKGSSQLGRVGDLGGAANEKNHIPLGPMTRAEKDQIIFIP